MSVREEIDTAQSQAELDSVLDKVAENISKIIGEVERVFQLGESSSLLEFEELKKALWKLEYLYSARRACQQWV